MKYPDACVVIPTYNEEATVGPLVRRAFACGVAAVLVVNDGSDGTAAMARAGGAEVIDHWPRRAGLAESILEGLCWAEAHGFTYAVVMDAGGSHDPDLTPALVETARRGHDLVIASRFLTAHAHYGWRTFVSRAASWCVRRVVGVGVQDATTGQRCYRVARVMPIIQFCRAKRFAVQMELLGYMVLSGGRAAEIPAHYVLTGSTFSNRMIFEALYVLLRLLGYRLFGRYEA